MTVKELIEQLSILDAEDEAKIEIIAEGNDLIDYIEIDRLFLTKNSVAIGVTVAVDLVSFNDS